MELRYPIAEPLGSISSSLAYLAEQNWWRPFRAGRRDVPLVDDALCVGHLCRWSEEHRVAIQDITERQFDAYLAALAPLRPALRPAYEQAARALVSFFVEPTTACHLHASCVASSQSAASVEQPRTPPTQQAA
jgi:hypothetical protein